MLLHELATARFVTGAAPVRIVGAAGTGKTHPAHAIGHQTLRQGFEVLALSQAQLETPARTSARNDRAAVPRKSVRLRPRSSCE